MKYFNLILIELCKKMLITDEFLAKEVGKHASTVKRWLGKETPVILPREGTVSKIHKALISWYQLPENKNILNDKSFQDIKVRVIEMLPAEEAEFIKQLYGAATLEKFIHMALYLSHDIKKSAPPKQSEVIGAFANPIEAPSSQEVNLPISQEECDSNPKQQESLPLNPSNRLRWRYFLIALGVIILAASIWIGIHNIFSGSKPDLNKVTTQDKPVSSANTFEDDAVCFIYQTFDNGGDEWPSWDCGSVERTLENSFNGSKVLKLVSKKLWGGCGIQCENNLWDVDLLPNNNDEQSNALSFLILALPDNKGDNTVCVKFFDQKFHKKEPVIYWTPNKIKYKQWDHVMIPLPEIRKISRDLNFHHIDKIEIQQYWPGTYYIENIYIVPLAPRSKKH